MDDDNMGEKCPTVICVLGRAICVHVDGQLRAPVGLRSGWGGHAAPWELGCSDLCLLVLWRMQLMSGHRLSPQTASLRPTELLAR